MRNAVIFQIILLIFQGTLYLGVQKFEGPAHDVKCRLDDKIPFWPPSTLVYVLWFPMLAVFPLLLFSDTVALYTHYILAIIVDIVMSSIIYLAYPTSFQRPDPPDTLTGKVVAILHKGNYTGKNCMPSMHCSTCFTIAFFSILSMSANPIAYAGFLILSLLIVLSTVLTKQHVIIDVITGLLAAIVSIFVAACIQQMI